MKKWLVAFFILLVLPLNINAQEYCTIESGTGKDIGDEIKCGTETFYVVSSDNEKKELLAKYNLFVGDKIDYFDITGTVPSTVSNTQYCLTLANEKGYNADLVYAMDTGGSFTGCRVYEKLEYEHILQDERAIGTKLVDGKSVLPLYGIVYMNPDWEYRNNSTPPEHTYDENGNLIIEGTSFEYYLDGYKEELEYQGIEVGDVSFITLSKTVNLLEKISGREFELNLEYPDNAEEFSAEAYTKIMDIKDYVGSQKWIYGTTYWLGSGFHITFEQIPDVSRTGDNDYYISNEGMLCALGRGECAYLAYPIGNGVRPLVTIPNSSLIYKIATKTDGNGTIEVVNTAKGNDSISFRVTSRKGYALNKLVITTDAEETVEFNKGSIINNADGTVSVDANRFIMPFDNIVIEASFGFENPDTGVIIPMMGIIGIIILGVVAYYLLNKKINELSL